MNDLPWGLQLAQKAFRKEWTRKKVTACFIEGNTIIIASNQHKTHPEAAKYGHRMNKIHAELAVLKNITDGSNGTLYVYRETFQGELAMARPCEFCQLLLKEKNVRKVVYTTNLGFAKEKFLPQ